MTCLADLVLAEAAESAAPMEPAAPRRTVGVTGTAGKTTTATILVQLLRRAGVEADAGTTGRLGNVWPTAELLARAHPARPLVLELTSSHLAFMGESPAVAAITCFWPDHLELHGSLDAYRAAKETIVRGQRPGDVVVVNADDPGAAAFAELTPASLVEASLARPVERGAHVRGDEVLLSWDGREVAAPLASLPLPVSHRIDFLVALATAAATGAPIDALARAVADIRLPSHRVSPVGTVDGVDVVDDGMAATPSKTAAALAGFPAAGVVLIAGGLDDLGVGPVHAAPEERELLERACDAVARAARLVVLFGPAALRLEPLLTARGVPYVRAAGLDEAVDLAVSRLEGARALLFSPMFPVSVADRERFADLVA